MPTYVYKFVETGETVEVQQSFADPTLTEYAHPETGVTMPVKKVFLPAAVTFKGDGFYKTDSRKNGSSSSSSKSVEKSGEKSSGGDGSSSDSSSSPSTSSASKSSESSSSSSSSTSSASSSD